MEDFYLGSDIESVGGADEGDQISLSSLVSLILSASEAFRLPGEPWYGTGPSDQYIEVTQQNK